MTQVDDKSTDDVVDTTRGRQSETARSIRRRRRRRPPPPSLLDPNRSFIRLQAAAAANAMATSGSGVPHQFRRKRSSADLGTNYPGDLLSLVRPRCAQLAAVSPSPSRTSAPTAGGIAGVTELAGSTRRLAVSGQGQRSSTGGGTGGSSSGGHKAPPPLLKRNTIGDFASTTAYHQLTSSSAAQQVPEQG